MLSKKHQEDLYGSGLDDKTIEEAGFFTCNAQEANRTLDRNDLDCDCLVIPYPGIENYYRFKPDGIVLSRDGKPARYLQKIHTESRLYIHKAIRNNLVSLNGNAPQLPLLIIEGEKKTLKATQEFYLKEQLFYPVGLSGVWNWRTTKIVKDERVKDVIDDFKSISINNRLIYICFDSDSIINDQVLEAENELGKYLIGRGASRVCCIRIPHEIGHKQGIDDYLVKYGNNKFKELVEQSTSSGFIKYSIKFIRKLPNSSFFEKADIIIGLIIKDLESGGKFYFDNNGSYYFANSSKKVFQIEEESFGMRLADDYGLYRNSSEWKSIIPKIEEHANFKGTEIKIKNVSYFDQSNRAVYIYNNNGNIFEIKQPANSSESTDIISRRNGYNSIFFKHREEFDRISYIPKSVGYFEKYILDVCNFQHTEHTSLSPDQQRFLFTIWFYCLFFPNLLPTKPILVMTGDYGSGKSTIQRVVGKLLFGDGWNVSNIQGERDFLTSIINKYYLVYDNIDINEEWVRNAIASLSTGFKVEVRKMYSNMEMFQADPISYLAMNSMTQGLYKRPDVASRLLIFRTKRIEGVRIPERMFYDNISQNRNAILSEVFDNLQNIIPFIDNKFSYYGNFRMADFANLGFKIATSMGREKEFEVILEIAGNEQATLPLEENPLIDLIDKYLNTTLTRTYLSTSELYSEMKKIADNNNLFFPFKSTISFGRVIQTSLENLKMFYSFNSRKGRSNKTEWLINYKDNKEK